MRYNKYYREIIQIPTPQNPIEELIRLNCLLKNLVGASQFSDALRLYQQIHSSHHFEPDQYTLSTALTACANSNKIGVGVQLHARSIQSGLKSFSHVTNTLLSLYAKSRDLVSLKRVFDETDEPDVYSHTTLLSACVKFGEFHYARQVFNEMPKRDVAVWNAMVTGCADNGHHEVAFDYFRRMVAMGVKVDKYAFASVLSLCSLEQFELGRQVHSLVVKTGCCRRVSVVNALLTMYFDCECVSDAYCVFEEVGWEAGDEITYNAIIAGLISMDRNEEAIFMFKDMKTGGLKPTVLTFVSVMGSCFSSDSARQVHGQAIKMSFECSTPVNNAAISMYSNCGQVDAALLIFKRLEDKDTVSWNAIIASYARENSGKDSIFAFLEMQRNCVEPDEFTIGSLLGTFDSLGAVEMIQAIAIKKALISKVEVLNSLISSFSRIGKIERASKLFCDTHSKNLVSWNSMISGFLLNNLPEHGLHHFSKLMQLGLGPNHYTISLCLSICSSILDIHRGKELHAYVIKSGYLIHTSLSNALIALYSKCGALHLSSRVFDGMTEKDNVTWNSIISAHAEHGEGKKAIHCFEAMQQYSSGAGTPDKATFTAVLSACSSRGGFLDIAEKLIQDRGIIDVDLDVWWTLFSSCVHHGYLKLGSIIAGFILETNKEDPAVYVLLSNLYADAGKWEESANLRELMKRYGVVKQPGNSWIT